MYLAGLPMESKLDKSLNNTLVTINDLKQYFPVTRGVLRRKIADIKAVDGVSFKINRGETLGLVGESGSGKTTTGQAILQIERPTGGKIFFEGADITGIGRKEIRNLRRQMQMIFQDPYSSLDPRMKVADIIGEPIIVHHLARNRPTDRKQEHRYFRANNEHPWQWREPSIPRPERFGRRKSRPCGNHHHRLRA